MTLKETIRDLGSRFLVSSGITRLGRRLHDRDGTIVLYGHRICDGAEAFFEGIKPSMFRDQISYLTRSFEVIPLDVLVRAIKDHRAPPPRSVVLTLDDGFRDNVEEAMPVLDEFGVSATVFVVTQSLTDGRLPWSQRLGYVFERTGATHVHDELLGPDPVALTDEAQRRQAYGRMMQSLMPLGRLARDAVIEGLAYRLEVEPPRDRMMTWEHARALLAGGHGIGAHTYSHALLARVSPEEARWEMERSRDDLADRLSLTSPAFCFPAGSTTPALRVLARELGFRSCFVPNRAQRINRPGDVDAFSLVRVGMPNAPATHLEAELDGPLHFVRRRLGRYARGIER